jgi:hypothetical protein
MSSSACAASEASVGEPWGNEAVGYFRELSTAYTEDDFYGILDFFSVDAQVHHRTSHFGKVPRSVPDLLHGNRADLSRQLLEVYLGTTDAITLIRWPNRGDFGAVVAELRNGLITSETVFVDAASLENSLRASPAVVARYQDLYDQYAWARSSGDPQRLAVLYGLEATVPEASGIEAWIDDRVASLAEDGSLRWSTVPVTSLALASPALFLDPIRYGDDPQRAVAVYQVEPSVGCSLRLAVRWEIADGLIVQEHRFAEVESFRRCSSGDLPRGWWTGLALPGPRDQLVTGTVGTFGGQTIEIHNGTTSLEELLTWGLRRFGAAGLVEPRVDSVTFEPTRVCDGVFGRVIDADGARDLFLCIDGNDLCEDPEPCGVPALNIRVGILHELGHAWMLDYADEEIRSRLLELSGREVWSDPGTAWTDRGVEYAAEVLAWGLADEPVRLVQLGDPPCEELTAAFQLLTGLPPLGRGADCQP